MTQVPSLNGRQGKRNISSAQTFFVKFFVPVLHATAGLGAWFFLFVGDPQGRHGSPSLFTRILFPTLWCLWTPSILRLCVLLKRVAIDDKALYVSNYRREIRIPFTAVSSISESVRQNGHLVTILFEPPIEWKRIVLLPKMPATFAAAFSIAPHPVVGEIRTAAELARRTLGK
jgi:hypothetical protein